MGRKNRWTREDNRSLLVPVLKTIEDIRFNKRGEENGAWNNNTVTLAEGLHKKSSGFEFIIALKVLSN